MLTKKFTTKLFNNVTTFVANTKLTLVMRSKHLNFLWTYGGIPEYEWDTLPLPKQWWKLKAAIRSLLPTTMRQIDNMTPNDIDTLYVKGMLTTNKTTKPMPHTITLRKRVKDAEKKHSVIFSTEHSTPAEQDIVDSIYFKQPFIEGVREITLTIARDVDTKLEQL